MAHASHVARVSTGLARPAISTNQRSYGSGSIRAHRTTRQRGNAAPRYDARVKRWLIAAAIFCGACAIDREPGWSARNPTEVICGCHDGDSCYEGAAQLAARRGETADTAEELLYFSQCACFQGSLAGCNTLGHFAKDGVRACDAGRDVANSCAIAGFVHRHGVRIPPLNGRSWDRDPVAAAAAFDRACRAGAQVACPHVAAP
jgi:hypothetical protein